MSKNISLIVISLFIISCAPTRQVIPEEILLGGFDFTSYSEKNFLFTPLSYTEDYDAIGFITTELYPEVEKKLPNINAEIKEWISKEIDGDKLLAAAYQRAVKMGADAIIELKILSITKREPEVLVNGLQLQGFAIKRK